MAIFAALQSAALAPDVTKTEITLGQTSDFSGPQAALVKETTEAAKAYFESINKQGRVNGRKIVLTLLDDGYDAKRTVENAKKLIYENHVLALILPRGTANSEALLPLLLEKRVPLLGWSADREGSMTLQTAIYSISARNTALKQSV